MEIRNEINAFLVAYLLYCTCRALHDYGRCHAYKAWISHGVSLSMNALCRHQIGALALNLFNERWPVKVRAAIQAYKAVQLAYYTVY